MPDKPLHQPHDKLFKTNFRDLPTAIAFFRTCLPRRTLRRLDFSRVALVPGSYVSARLRASESDLLFRVGLKGSPDEVFVYLLFEHQYEEEYWLALRILRYLLDIWDTFRKDHPGVRLLPPVIPLVLAHNRTAWSLPVRFDADQFAIPGEARADLLPYLPAFRFELVQLSGIPFDKITGTPLGVMTLRVFKAQRLGGDYPASKWVWDEPLLARLGTMALEQLVAYIAARPEFDIVDIEAKVAGFESETVRKTVMTIAERYIEKGRLEGIEKGELIGRIHTLQELLGKAMTPRENLLHKSPAALKALLQKLRAEHRAR
ncbi:transposase [Opitutaceae bacterium TAV5]|nr:transposase [Opitutaceae bacterium TAV5]